MREFLVRGTQAEKKGAEDSCLPINYIEDTLKVQLYRLITVLGQKIKRGLRKCITVCEY
jgi:hypothetical protein